MSTDSLAHESRDDGQTTQANHGKAGEDVENTPTSEAPPSVNVITPSAGEAMASASQSQSAASADYFALHPAPSTMTTTALDQQQAQPLSQQPLAHPTNAQLPIARARTPHSNPSPAASVTGSDGSAARPHSESAAVNPSSLLHISPRPTPQTAISSLSIESTESSATVRPNRPALTTQLTFPSQALAELHKQKYPASYVPSYMRGGPHVNTFSAAIASHYGRRGIQTSHNSPAVTPSTAGLFDPAGPASAVPLETESDASGTYASPFLHFTHAIAPKETHTADVDFDPVSGRKVINNYEIVDELGRGTHGKVKLGRDLYDERKYVAIKIVERFSKRRKLGRLGTTEDKVKKEVAILKKARHPNVVALLEVIDDPSRKKVYIVLEWVEQGEIRWRTKGPKEIAMVEARRYEREKSGILDERKAAEDRAVLDEAKKRLETKKQERLRAARRSRRAARNNPAAWSIEMTGDDSSDSDDALSRISSVSHGRELDVVASSQQQQWLDPGLGRRPSRTPTPLQPALDTAIAHPSRFLKLTAEPETLSPISSDPTPLSAALQSSIDHLTGLEGTMYGAYDPVYGASLRIASLPSSLRGSQHGSSEGLAALADELLDSDLDSDLEHVPVMTMEQIRVAFRDTLLGLQYLHYQGIIHRDIKPPNLLSTSLGRVKISDFGVSYLGRPVAEGEGEDVSEAEAHDLGDEAKELAKTVGTPAFYAPELCSTDPADEPLPVTKAIDVWALGITLFCMLFARTPFVDDQYVVMRQIADEEVFIPRQRLQPVEFDSKSRSSSRASSRARHSLHPPATKRMDLEFAYENLGDELHDLLTRLLIKDPRSRITLEEVRHHPWVLADLPEREQWLEETDPTRQAEKKIEISKDEINTAVVPLNLMERIKSVAKGVGTKLGLGTRRERSQSSASQSKDGSPGPSAHSSSSTISQDARRMSIRPDQIVSALQSSHDQHPLAKSVAASPESGKASGRLSRLNGHSDAGHRLSRVPSRPTPNRAMTVASTTESMRTVTQSDFVPRGAKDESPPPSPGLPGTPTALASQGGSALGGLLGGAARMVNRVRESSRQRSRQRRGPTSETGSVHSSDPHAEASIAVSDATAAGHVHQPETLRGEYTPNSSVHNSPASSRPQSVTSDHQHLHPSPVEPGLLSRMSSTSSVASRGRRERYREYNDRPASRSRRAHGAHESTAEQWQRADEERIRKLVREHREETERANSARSSPYFGTPPDLFPITRTCPTSPDDDIAKRQDSQTPSVADMSNSDTPDESVSPTHHTGQLPPALLSSSSDLGSAVSMSISNPSIPSVISEASSISPSMHGDIYDDVKGQPSSDDTLNPASGSQEDFDDDINGYSPDQEEAAINSDGDEDFDSSSDSDGGLVMSRRKSAAKHGGHGVAAPLGVHKERRGTGLSTRSKKSSRSGSNNTMKKVRTRESGDEQSRRSLDIREE